MVRPLAEGSMTILLISDDDRSALACNLLAAQLKKRGQTCLTAGLSCDPKRDSPFPLSQPQVMLSPEALLTSSLLEQASALGVFLKHPRQLGEFINSHRHLAAHKGRQAAPVFSGPLQASLGDSLMEQLYGHLNCDLLLLPGERQHQAVSSITQHWPAEITRPRLLTTGLWFMPERPATGSLNGGRATPPHLLLALVQDDAPSATGGKSQFLRQLMQWAQASPDWSVVVQRDCNWDPDRHWIPRFKPEEWSLPNNLVFAAPGQLLSHLGNCSACVTVSSPWAMTAMSWGRKTMLVGDYGIHTNEGTTSWFGCGSMHRLQSIQQLDQLLELPDSNKVWLESMGWGVHDGVDRLINALEELKA